MQSNVYRGSGSVVFHCGQKMALLLCQHINVKYRSFLIDAKGIGPRSHLNMFWILSVTLSDYGHTLTMLTIMFSCQLSVNLKAKVGDKSGSLNLKKEKFVVGFFSTFFKQIGLLREINELPYFQTRIQSEKKQLQVKQASKTIRKYIRYRLLGETSIYYVIISLNHFTKCILCTILKILL